MRNEPTSAGTNSTGCLLLARIVALVLIVLMFGIHSSAYSVLTHEEIVDLLWTDQTLLPACPDSRTAISRWQRHGL